MMVKHIPDVLKVMSPFPNHLISSATVAEAIELATVQKTDFIVAVNEHGDPEGIVYSEILGIFAAEHSDWELSKFMSKRFLVADAHEPFDRVLELMSKDKLPIALITHKGKLSGSFSYTECANLLKQAIHNKPITAEPPDITA
jgi:predicted transcriptional regulator